MTDGSQSDPVIDNDVRKGLERLQRQVHNMTVSRKESDPWPDKKMTKVASPVKQNHEAN